MEPSRFPSRHLVAILASVACHAGLLLGLWLWGATGGERAAAGGGAERGGSGLSLVWLSSVDPGARGPAALAPAAEPSQPIMERVSLARPAQIPQPTPRPTTERREPRSTRAEPAVAEVLAVAAVEAIAQAPLQAEPASPSGSAGPDGVDVAAAGRGGPGPSGSGPAGGAGAPGTGRAGTDGSGLRSAHDAFADYLVALSARVQERLPIPRLARRRGLEDGDGAVVRVVLDAAGELRRVELAQSSGFASFDRDALRTIERAAPFGPVPSGTPPAKLDFDLPIVYER